MYFTFERSGEDFADNLAIVLLNFFAATSWVAQDIGFFDCYTGNLVDIILIIDKTVEWNAHLVTP
jgi:hypothetical protein